MEVIPGIHRFKLPLINNPADYVNTYLIKSDNGWILIDTGWNEPQLFDDLHKQLQAIDVGFEDIELVIYTHIHPDHYGLAGVLKQMFGTKLAVHKYGKDSIDYRYFGKRPFIQELGEWHIKNGGSEIHRKAVIEMSAGYIDHVVPVIPDKILSDGDIIPAGPFELAVIWTPGHDHDHVCFYEQHKHILFSGDHVLPGTITHIGIQNENTLNPLDDYVKSLQSIRHLEIDLALPGHENPFEDIPNRIDQLLDYHEQIASQVLKTIRNESLSAFAIAAKINWAEGSFNWDNLTPLVQAGLVTKTLAYLKSFVMESKAQRVDKNGLTVYNST